VNDFLTIEERVIVGSKCFEKGWSRSEDKINISKDAKDAKKAGSQCYFDLRFRQDGVYQLKS
jgi:hypothetical protein